MYRAHRCTIERPSSILSDRNCLPRHQRREKRAGDQFRVSDVKNCFKTGYRHRQSQSEKSTKGTRLHATHRRSFIPGTNPDPPPRQATPGFATRNSDGAHVLRSNTKVLHQLFPSHSSDRFHPWRWSLFSASSREPYAIETEPYLDSTINYLPLLPDEVPST